MALKKPLVAPSATYTLRRALSIGSTIAEQRVPPPAHHALRCLVDMRPRRALDQLQPCTFHTSPLLYAPARKPPKLLRTQFKAKSECCAVCTAKPSSSGSSSCVAGRWAENQGWMMDDRVIWFISVRFCRVGVLVESCRETVWSHVKAAFLVV
jgi:hypothetical protein